MAAEILEACHFDWDCTLFSNAQVSQIVDPFNINDCILILIIIITTCCFISTYCMLMRVWNPEMHVIIQLNLILAA